jgi:hypothetical protein
MNKVQVSFSYWERKAQNSVSHTVTNRFDGQTAGCRVLTPWYEEETSAPGYSQWCYKPSKAKMFFMDQLAFCQAGLLCILAKADSVRLAVHALDVEATLSRSCQLKHAFKTTNFITMQHMQIVSFAANYWKHFHSTRLICTSGRACMQRIFMK